MCPELSKDDIKSVFNALDADGDGQISHAEFSQGFADIGKVRHIVNKYNYYCEVIHRLHTKSIHHFVRSIGLGLLNIMNLSIIISNHNHCQGTDSR